MKKLRKGFTLVELLIVISILGALSASMAGSMGNATATAKASTIVANIDTCITAAKLFYAENLSDANINSSKDIEFLEETTDYIPNWSKFKENGNITYSAVEGAGPSNWAVKVDFTKAPDKENIATALKKIKGYDATDDATKIDAGAFKVKLMSGTIEAGS